MTFDLIIRNGTCVTPSGIVQADIGITNDTITEIGTLDASVKAHKTIDAKGLHVLPGVIDSQVHFREPGNEHKEDLESGTRAAVLGGVTTIFEMPNTNPPTTSEEALNDKLNRAKGRAWCDHAFFVGGTPDGANWWELERLPGCSGIKIFMGSSTGNLLVEQDAHIENILKNSRRRVAVHCEDEPRLRERKHIAEEGKHAKYHPIWRDEETALNATKRLVAIARKTGHRVNVLHVTTKQEMEFLAKHKDVATVECLPQHLTFTDADYERLGTHLQMNPPIRGKEHQDALWHAINSGIVDVLGSDHAPHTKEEKEKPYPESPAGLPGVQTLLPVMLNHINHGKLTLERLVDLVCHGPARIYQIARKGRLCIGYDADITIVDMNATHTLKQKDMASKCGWTPYEGMECKGKPTHTIIRGNIVMQDGTLNKDKAIGQPVRFQDTLQSQE